MTRQSIAFALAATLCGCMAAPSDSDLEAEIEVGSTSQALFAGSEWVRASEPRRHIYDPSVGETGPWYFNDHTFVYHAATQTWHLFGIVAPEPIIPLAYDVDAADDFGHATAPSILGPWTKKPHALHTSAEPPYAETHLWAPHVIEHQGTYYMFYSGGGPDQTQQEINLATSTDPKLEMWTRVSTGPLFRDGYQARDPMVLRVGTEWVMYYTATLTAQGGKHVVAYRKAPNLTGPWGERKIAFEDLREGTDAGPTESPFVMKRGDWYYLFIGPRPYHLYIPPDYPGSDVFASKDPLKFDLSQQVGHLPVHAAEVVNDGTRYWVSDAGWALGGVYVWPLDFHVTPVSGSTLYARSPNGDSVRRYNGSPNNWTQIGGPSKQLVGGGFGTFSVHPTTNDIYRYNGTPNSWTRVGGPRTGFAVNAIGLYARDGSGVHKWSGSGTTWTKIGGPATNLYAGGNDLYATNNITGDLYRYSGAQSVWSRIGDPGTGFAANANGVYGHNAWGVFQYTGQDDRWVQIGTAADKLYAGGNSLYATVPFLGDLNYYKNAPSNWAKASGPSNSYAVCDDGLYALRSSGVFKQTGSTWTQIGGAASSIACGK